MYGTSSRFTQHAPYESLTAVHLRLLNVHILLTIRGRRKRLPPMADTTCDYMITLN